MTGIQPLQPLLRLDERDNVLIVIRQLDKDAAYSIDGKPMSARETYPIGFKLAAVDMAQGTIVLRAGVPIGRMIVPVQSGELVHLHNLESLYIRTHARGEA